MNDCSIQIQQMHIRKAFPDGKVVNTKAVINFIIAQLADKGYTVEGPVLHFDTTMSFPGMKYDENRKLVPETPTTPEAKE